MYGSIRKNEADLHSASRVTSRTWKRAHSVLEMNSRLLFVNM